MAKAAVMIGQNLPLEIRTDVEVEAPRANEVKVRMGASGVCHSDLSMMNGTMFCMPPIVLGHEGAGVVEEVGEGVTSVAPGDHVVISWVAAVRRLLLLQQGPGLPVRELDGRAGLGWSARRHDPHDLRRRAAHADGRVGHVL